MTFPVHESLPGVPGELSACEPPPCELCAGAGGTILWQDSQCRVVAVADPDYPGFCRVIWNAHVRELTDLAPGQRQHLMAVVWATESAVRGATGAHKMNVASLGNLCPHVHWHVIPRHMDDPHFPAPVWAERRRNAGDRRADLDAGRGSDPAALAHTIGETLQAVLSVPPRHE